MCVLAHSFIYNNEQQVRLTLYSSFLCFCGKPNTWYNTHNYQLVMWTVKNELIKWPFSFVFKIFIWTFFYLFHFSYLCTYNLVQIWIVKLDMCSNSTWITKIIILTTQPLNNDIIISYRVIKWWLNFWLLNWNRSLFLLLLHAYKNQNLQRSFRRTVPKSKELNKSLYLFI